MRDSAATGRERWQMGTVALIPYRSLPVAALF